MTTTTSKTNGRATSKRGATGPTGRSAPKKTPAPSLGARMEQTVLIQLGAVLVVRDTLLKVSRPYRERASASKEIRRQLRRFERRGAVARQQMEAELAAHRERAGQVLHRTPASHT